MAEPTETIPGSNTLVIGEAGAGKTHSLATLVEAGLKVGYLGLEPGLESLLGYWTDKGKKVPENLAYHVIEPTSESLEDMMKMTQLVNESSFKALANYSDAERNKKNQMLLIYKALSNFTDHRTGKSLGPVDKWGADCALGMDGLTGLNDAALSMVIGNKPNANEGEYGIAMGQIERLLRKLTRDCRCHFALIGHVIKQPDLIQGGQHISMNALGNKLAPKIAPMFGDIVYAYRDGKEWYWSTEITNVATKVRNLPVSNKLPPDFRTIINRWRDRQKGVLPTETE